MQNATHAEADAWREVPFYGGAIVCEIPASFSDMSMLREVPDHQEVWCENCSDRSVIVEILERKTEVPDNQAIQFFLNDLGTANDARDTTLVLSRALTVNEVPHLPEGTTSLHGVCEQSVSKFNESVANRVRVHLCAIRLAAQDTDILITLNDPVEIDPQSSSAEAPVMQGSEALFARILKSFNIVDWDLFG